VKENELLRIEGPKGTFFIRDTSKPLVFLATGTGIAPIMSILKRLDQNHDFNQQCPIYLFIGNRFAYDHIWKPEFKKLKVQVEIVVSKPDSFWMGNTGYVQTLALSRLGVKISECNVYACGSSSMIKSSKESFISAGLLEKQFYSDAFVQSY